MVYVVCRESLCKRRSALGTHLELLKEGVQVQLHGLGVAQVGPVPLVAIPAQHMKTGEVKLLQSCRSSLKWQV